MKIEERRSTHSLNNSDQVLSLGLVHSLYMIWARTQRTAQQKVIKDIMDSGEEMESNIWVI